MTRLIRVLALGLLAMVPLVWSQQPGDLLSRQEQQRQIQAETDRMVRRIGAMLRVMEYYQLDKTAERQILEEVATTLAGLSQEQMTAVIAKLEEAANEADTAKSQKEVEEAYARHREIVASLKGLLATYDAVRSLDQAAERLDRASRDQVELSLQTLALGHDLSSGRYLNERFQGGGGRNMRGVENPYFRAQRMADDQDDFRKEAMAVWKQTEQLGEQLPDDQRERLEQAGELVKSSQVFDAMSGAYYRLREPNFIDDEQQSWAKAFGKQWEAADRLLELSYAVREPREQVIVLREARLRLGRVLTQQEALVKDTHALADLTPQEDPLDLFQFFDRRGGFRAREDDTPSARARELADRQARVEHSARDGRHLLKPHAEELAARVEAVEDSMQQVQTPLRARKTEDANNLQEQALTGLRTILIELDRLILQAEQQRQDPLAAVQRALEAIDAIIRDQQDTRQNTELAERAGDRDQLSNLATPQTELSRRADALRQAPLPPNREAQAALGRAAGEMTQAAQELRQQQGEPAQRNQEEALRALEEARRELAEQAAAIEQRRQEMANLENAARRIEELARQERGVADQAKALSEKASPADARPAGEQQAKITPQTREVAEQVRNAAREAAAKLDQAARNMDTAKAELDKPRPQPAAREADEATRNLQEAHRELTRELEQRLGQELADQAAMQPNRLNPDQAARDIAQALEQAQRAQAESQKATPRDNQQADLAKLQREIAQKADRMNLEKAARPADRAADELQRGDLNSAVEQQRQALERLQEAARQQRENQQRDPQSKDAQAKSGQSKDAQAKSGQSKDAQAKSGQSKDAQAKSGQSKDAQAKSGQSKDAQAKSGQSKSGQSKDAQAKSGQPKSGQGGQQQSPQNAEQLAQAQRELLEATQALQRSQAANQAARSAVNQAQANAPRGVQQQLGQASEQLSQAAQSLQQSRPTEAGNAQGEAAQSLQQALNALQAAQQAAQARGQGQEKGQGKGQEKGQGKGQEQGQGKGQQKGQGKGERGQKGQGKGERGQQKGEGQQKGQGQQQGRNNQPGQAQEKNQNRGEGNRLADGTLNNANSLLNDPSGEGTFLSLPPRQRELIRQALSDKLPPEYAAIIEQYFVNIAQGKPAAKPTTEPGKDK